MRYKISKKEDAVCLECGDHITYGRQDKKFCCEECRYRYNNHLLRERRAYKRRLFMTLERNYEVLNGLLNAGVSSIDLTDLINLGFVPNCVTSYHKVRKHDEYTCFDIKYIMTASRIWSITKISLNLQVGPEKNNTID